MMSKPHIARVRVGFRWEWGVWISTEVLRRRAKPFFHSKDFKVACLNAKASSKMRAERETV